jgi:hypothetical protein
MKTRLPCLGYAERDNVHVAGLDCPMPTGTRIKEDTSVHHGCFSQAKNHYQSGQEPKQ